MIINWLCQSFFKQISLKCADYLQVRTERLSWYYCGSEHTDITQIIFCQIIGGSSSVLTNEPISQSFSQSWASWTRQQPGSNPALEGNWRRGRHGVRLSKRAEGCVSKGLAEAHETSTRSKGVGCVGGHSGGRMSGRKTERQTETERIEDKGMWFWNDWEWNHLCWQSHGNCVSVWIGVRESGSEGDSVCVCVCVCVCVWRCMCISTARRPHGKFLPRAVVCFLSVKPYTGNIQNTFRQTPSWWWWTLEVTQSSGENNVYCAKDLC